MQLARQSTRRENMKKTLSKLSLSKKTDAPAGRITTDTLAEHREQVLAGGRRFKYPVQYAKHKLVFNAIIVAIGALIILGTLGWWQLYKAQNTSDFMYRVSKAFALPVATVDGEPVLYGDYLMRYRSSIQYLLERDQINLSTEDGKQQADYVKRRELDGAIADAYATKIARERGITVTDAELETFLIQQRQSPDGEVSEATYNAVILDYYGWSPEEYRHAMKNKLIRQKVAYAIDTTASAHVESVHALIKGGTTNLQTIAEKMNSGAPNTVQYSVPLWVPRTNHDGGLAEVAAKLKKGEISGAVQIAKGTGYYFVKLIDSNEAQVQYELVQIPLTALDQQLEAVRKEGAIKEYIDIPEVAQGE